MGELNDIEIQQRKCQQDANLLSLFYAHRLHIEDPVPGNVIPSCMVSLCADILSMLKQTSVPELLEIIKQSHVPFAIDKADIPQFSSLEDAALKVPHLIFASQMEDITYEQMGFLLRTEPRTVVADCKYGENHAKTAAEMGLCAVYKHRVCLSFLGLLFDEQSEEDKKNLIPKLVLFIPMIQNLFVAGADENVVNDTMSILSESTLKRRSPNVWALIDCVNSQLPYELQIHRY